MRTHLLIMTLFVSLVMPGMTGCLFNESIPVEPIYQGDVAAFNGDRTINTSYSLMNDFVLWEKEHRDVFASIPEVKAAADNIRLNGRQWIASAIALNEAYKTDPTEEKRSAVEAALDIIDVALTEATKIMISQPPQ